jgi:hypothetical protein
MGTIFFFELAYHQIHKVFSDLTVQNIMMDGRLILPQRWHFTVTRRGRAPNGVKPIAPLARIYHPVQYFIDDDGSMIFIPGQSHLLEDLKVTKDNLPK